MVLIEAKQTSATPTDTTQPDLGNSPPSNLLTLLNDLHPLNEQQQAIIATLRQELLALAV